MTKCTRASKHVHYTIALLAVLIPVPDSTVVEAQAGMSGLLQPAVVAAGIGTVTAVVVGVMAQKVSGIAVTVAVLLERAFLERSTGLPT